MLKRKSGEQERRARKPRKKHGWERIAFWKEKGREGRRL